MGTKYEISIKKEEQYKILYKPPICGTHAEGLGDNFVDIANVLSDRLEGLDFQDTFSLRVDKSVPENEGKLLNTVAKLYDNLRMQKCVSHAVGLILNPTLKAT